MIQCRHALQALEACLFLWIDLVFLLLDCGHIYWSKVLRFVQVFIEGILWMEGVVDIRRIFAGIFENDVVSTRVVW